MRWSKIIHALCKLHANLMIARDTIHLEKSWICKINYECHRHGSDQPVGLYLIPPALLMPINYFKLHYRLTHRSRYRCHSNPCWARVFCFVSFCVLESMQTVNTEHVNDGHLPTLFFPLHSKDYFWSETNLFTKKFISISQWISLISGKIWRFNQQHHFHFILFDRVENILPTII